jgi:IS30 family transposase
MRGELNIVAANLAADSPIVKGGVPNNTLPKAAQLLARRSTITLTMDRHGPAEMAVPRDLRADPRHRAPYQRAVVKEANGRARDQLPKSTRIQPLKSLT